MTAVLNGLARIIMVLCCALTLAIIGALSVQIFSRYVLNAPVHMSDDVAEISLIWLTFLGAAMVYREGGHISVDLIASMESARVRRALGIALHVLVIAVLVHILTQVWHLRLLMMRLEYGTVPYGPLTSKFVLILVPFGAGAILTILFAAEAIVKGLRRSEIVE